jgi:hypothetical protein
LNGIAAAKRDSSPFSLAAETIFIEAVIFLMFFVDWIWFQTKGQAL